MAEIASDTVWRPLYRAGGVAALITAVLIALQIVVFVAWPPPLEGSTREWFTLLQDNWLLELLSLDLLLISVPSLWIWYVLIGRRLIQLGSGVSREGKLNRT